LEASRREGIERCTGTVYTLAAADMLGARFMRSYWKALGEGMDTMVIPNRGRVLAVISALALAGGLLTLALLAKPSQAQGQGAVVEQFPISFIQVNNCTGEEVLVEGTLHTVTQSVTDEEDRVHDHSSDNLSNVTAVGRTSGDEYILQGLNHAEFNGSPTSSDTSTASFTTRFIRVGPDTPEDDLLASGFLHFTINANGEVTSEVELFKVECH
jgi:hypothetical protein